MSTPSSPASDDVTATATRDIAEVAAVEVITTAAVHLMSAAAVKCGLGADEPNGAFATSNAVAVSIAEATENPTKPVRSSTVLRKEGGSVV